MKPTKAKVLVTIFVVVLISIPVSHRINTLLAVRSLKASIGKPFDPDSATHEIITDSVRAQKLMDFVGITQRPETIIIHIPGEGLPYFTGVLLVDMNTGIVVDAKVKEMW